MGLAPQLGQQPALVIPIQKKPSLPSRIAVVGNYLPRQCGIATFTTDLCEAISAEYGAVRLMALPINDTEQAYDYPERVRWSLAQDDVAAYQEAAEFLNVSRPYVAKLLDDGVLPYRQVGSHRRIPYADLAAYREQERARARKAMQRLTSESEDLGLYDLSDDRR